MILARHAEALLWAGRYLERAESTARCLNYAAKSVIELRDDEARAEGELLIRTLGLQNELAAAGPLLSRPQLVAFLLSDRDNPGSLVSAVCAVRENLRTVRDRIPIELWEEVNGLYLKFPFLGHESEISGLHEVLLTVRTACLAVSGVMNEGMRRDEGHALMVVGRMLERSIFTVGLLEATCSDPRGRADATRMLRLTSSLQAFHRRHSNAPEYDSVTRYLLHAAELPRSLLSSLTAAEQSLSKLGSPGSLLEQSRRRAGLLRARLELGQVEQEMESAPAAMLTSLAGELADLADEVCSGIVPPLAIATVHSQFVRPGADSDPDGDGESAAAGGFVP
ncbi:MAG: alpha-E domain-containing protein [Acidimicrobiaceae bacterium]|nr:alpha-E domain-containing protein [Acidimicrobiaceae bacterium]MCY4279153.1 alpha-E domain-containing protein [Acidimicrobiaceae bacterium]MCY4294761.1 alpha-E domain-containing protein [Acidimicrobiaceae bacterium]